MVFDGSKTRDEIGIGASIVVKGAENRLSSGSMLLCAEESGPLKMGDKVTPLTASKGSSVSCIPGRSSNRSSCRSLKRNASLCPSICVNELCELPSTKISCGINGSSVVITLFTCFCG